MWKVNGDEEQVKLGPFATMLRDARLKSGLTASYVASKLKISVVYYLDVEQGRKPPFPLGGKVSYELLASVVKLDRATLELASGSVRDAGYKELVGLLEKSFENLMYGRSSDDPVYIAYISMQEKGIGALPELCEIVRKVQLGEPGAPTNYSLA
jgi:transcriptional regulator with XRE-family HTH domain